MTKRRITCPICKGSNATEVRDCGKTFCQCNDCGAGAVWED